MLCVTHFPSPGGGGKGTNSEDVETAQRVGVARTEDKDVQRVGTRRLAQDAQGRPKALARQNHPFFFASTRTHAHAHAIQSV